MKPKRQFDPSRITGPILFSVLLLSACGGLLWFSIDFAEGLAQDQQEVQISLNRLTRQFAKHAADLRLSDEYGQRFDRFQRANLFVKGNKLDWIDAIRHAAKTIGLPNAEYEIGPTEPYRSKLLSGTPGLQLLSTPVRLRLGLLHEGDLLSMMAMLQRARIGVFSLDQCNLARQSGNFAATSLNPRVSAECQISAYGFDFDHQPDPSPMGAPGLMSAMNGVTR